MYLTAGVAAIVPFYFVLKIFTNYLKQDFIFFKQNEILNPRCSACFILSGWIFLEALSLMSSCLAILFDRFCSTLPCNFCHIFRCVILYLLSHLFWSTNSLTGYGV
jgi:hypothetical protein